MTQRNDVIDSISTVARGEADPLNLNAFGIRIFGNTGEWTIGSYDGQPYHLIAQDVQQALSQFGSNESRRLRWATFILAASDLICISDDDLLEKIWDLAFSKG